MAGVYSNQFPQSDSNAYITQNEAASLLPSSADHATTIYVRTRPGVTETQEVSRLEKTRAACNSSPPPTSAPPSRTRQPPTS